jgi:hypothetical protein
MSSSRRRYIDDRLDPLPYHNPEDEDRDGPQNVGLFSVQLLDPYDKPKELQCNHSLGKHQIVLEDNIQMFK